MLKSVDKKNLFKRLVEDDYRYYVQMQYILVLVILTSAVMSIMNYFTDQREMMMVTFVFFVICLLDLWIIRRAKRAEGFSVIWICLLPACGMLFSGLKRGVILCAIMFGITVFLLWTSGGQALLRYEYSPHFHMRFPFLYLFFFAIGYIFEKIRAETNYELHTLRAKYERISVTDTLTRVHNRYWFNEQRTKMISEEMQAEPSAAILVDIDHFKRINDVYGHAFGDVVLAQVALAIEACLRKNDWFCRWGGEEFLAFIPGCSRETAVHIGERMRSAVNNLRILHESGEEVTVTVSIGIAFTEAGQVWSDTELFSYVDRMLYDAKKCGRNCIRSGMLK
jgi:diguanylate cyclase (GGDEF)-like protein